MKTTLYLKRSAVSVKGAVEWYLYHRRYLHHTVLIIGLEKSGSTWLRNMFNALPGFHTYLPRHVTPLDHSLRQGMFDPYRRRLAVVRLHTVWTPEASEILRHERVPYIIQYRDLRDTAISWYFYVAEVQNKHVLHDKIAAMSLEQGLDWYIDRLLPVRARFIRDWRSHRDPEFGHELSYEALRTDTLATFSRLARACLGDIPDHVLAEAVEKNNFRRLTGRNPGEENRKAFVRKGVSGDWRNYFTPAQKDRFKAAAGELLIELGYEKDMNW